MRAWPRITGVALAAAALWPSSATAQVELVPALGAYWPVGGWRQQEDDGSGYLRLRRQLFTALVGARLAVWVSPHVAIEAMVGASPSQVAVSTAEGTSDFNAGVYLASARAVYKAGTLKDGASHDLVHWDIMLGAGAGVVHRAGTAWQNTSGVTAPALVLTTAVGVGAFRLSFEDYVSWAQFDVGLPTQTRARMHHDVIFSLGFTVRLAGP